MSRHNQPAPTTITTFRRSRGGICLLHQNVGSCVANIRFQVLIAHLNRLGDYYRYLAEYCAEDKGRCIELSLTAYKLAYKRAMATLKPLHPTRLGVALNFAVFFHDCRSSPERACHVAKHALDDAVASMVGKDLGNDPAIDDAMLILQLLRDNLLVWSTEINGK